MTTDQPHKLSIPSNHQHPAVESNVGRITVFLGGNGTGKSALLQSMHAKNIAPSLGRASTRRIDARRIMQMVGRSMLKRTEVNDNIEQIANTILESYSPNDAQLRTEASKLLEALCHRDRRRDIEYAKECDSLVKLNQQATIGPRPSSPLDEFIALFKSVLPDLTLDFNTSSVTLKVQNGGTASYGPESLSSGEQQVFLLLGKFIFDHRKVVFLVDEPELNLNPRLAEKFWSTVERRHQECAFIYATHALHFALRPEVNRALVLTRNGVVPLDASEEFLELAREDREQFLGSIPSIVVANKVLFTEGNPDSIDRAVYEYLLQDSSIKVEAIGSCNEVEKAVGGKQGWANFTRDAHVAGVIDADYKPESELERLRRLGVFVLPLHEAESILCFPAALSELSRTMHPEHARVSVDEVADAFRKRLVARRIVVAIRRAEEKVRLRFAPSIPASEMSATWSDDEAIEAFDRAVSANRMFLQSQDAKSVLQDEFRRIDEALKSDDLELLLRLLPGKELAKQACSMLQIKGGSSDLLAYYQKHFPSRKVPYFEKLGDALAGIFQPDPQAIIGPVA